MMFNYLHYICAPQKCTLFSRAGMYLWGANEFFLIYKQRFTKNALKSQVPEKQGLRHMLKWREVLCNKNARRGCRAIT